MYNKRGFLKMADITVTWILFVWSRTSNSNSSRTGCFIELRRTWPWIKFTCTL